MNNKKIYRWGTNSFLERRLVYYVENPVKPTQQESITEQCNDFQKQLRSLQDKLGLTMKDGVIIKLEERKSILKEMNVLRGGNTNPSIDPAFASSQNSSSDYKNFPTQEGMKDLDIYNFDYSPISSIEKKNTEIIVSGSDDFHKKIQNKEILPNSTILLEGGTYSGSFEIWEPNVKIIAKDEKNPPVFTGGGNGPYSLIFHESGSESINLSFRGGEIGLRLNKENNRVHKCSFSGQKRLGIDCKASNSMISNCSISQFYKDGVFIQGDNVTVETCNFYDYMGTEDAHNDAIQIAAKATDKSRFLGKDILKNIRIIGNTIDMGGGHNSENEKLKPNGKNLQGIFAGQVILQNAVIMNNQIAVDSQHGITGSFLGDSVISENNIRKAGDGTTIPHINILASRAANVVLEYIPAEYSVLVRKNEWGDDGDGEHFYNVWNHSVKKIEDKK